MREMIIDGVTISDDSDCFVIAEIGNNHQGDVGVAKKMIRKATLCGASAVKLQKRDNQQLFTKDLYNMPYDNRNSFGQTYGAHREALEFGLKEYQEIVAYAKDIGITLLATAFDQSSAEFLHGLDMPVYKVASGDLKNTPLLKQLAGYGKPMIISTGGGTIEDVKRAYEAIMPINDQLAILQCTSGYPARFDELDLRVIELYREMFPNAVIGLSSHEDGHAMPLVAYALGARIVEKHFTLDRTNVGTDHVFSLEPRPLNKLVKNLQHARMALGRREKVRHESEKGPMGKMEKKLIAAKNLSEGHVLTVDDIDIRCPGNGTPPYELDSFLGKKLTCAVLEEEDLTFDHISTQ